MSCWDHIFNAWILGSSDLDLDVSFVRLDGVVSGESDGDMNKNIKKHVGQG